MPFSKDPEAYPPEYQRLFEQGYKNSFELDLKTHPAAVSLRHRLHAYRRALRASGSPLFPLVASCEVIIEGSKLTVRPKALALREAFASSGIEYDSSSLPDKIQAEEDEAGDALEKLLKKQGYGKETDPNADRS